MDGLDGCYWVEEGRFLAGPYPHSSDRITRLGDLGVTLFLDLTEPGEYGSLRYDGLLADGMRAISKPMRDFTAPRRDEMREILDLIDGELAAGGVVYLHCYGGIGRTGTVVGCYLVRHGTPCLEGAPKSFRIILKSTRLPAWMESVSPSAPS